MDPVVMGAEERVRFLRYTRPERWPALERMPVTGAARGALLAAMLRCTVADVDEVTGRLDRSREETARQLLADPTYRIAVESLPFPAGSRVVAVGDSLTADRVGWFELLTASLEQCGRSDVVMRNLGLSGDTTADVLERFDILEAARPTHVVVLLGTNDARTHGRRDGVRMATPAETRRNLSALRGLIVSELAVTPTLITPPPADQRRITEFFRGHPLRWSAAELDDVAEAVREVDPGCLDLAGRIRGAEHAGFLESDGVHLTPEGQRFVARAVAEHLAGA